MQGGREHPQGVPGEVQLLEGGEGGAVAGERRDLVVAPGSVRHNIKKKSYKKKIYVTLDKIYFKNGEIQNLHSCRN